MTRQSALMEMAKSEIVVVRVFFNDIPLEMRLGEDYVWGGAQDFNNELCSFWGVEFGKLFFVFI